MAKLANHFQTAWEQMNQNFAPTRFVSDLRQNFSERSWPDRRDENFKYTSLGRLSDKIFQLAPKEQFEVTPTVDSNRIVFVNGFLSSVHISEKNITVSEEEVEFSVLKQKINQFMSELNQAGGTKTTYIHIKGQILRPLNIQYFNIGCDEKSLAQPRLNIKLAANSKISIIEESVDQSPGGLFVNKLCQIVLGEDSQLDHYRIQCEGLRTIYNATNQVEVEKNAVYNTWHFNYGSLLGREINQVRLVSEYASTEIYGLYLPNGKRQHDHQIEVYHDAKNTTSKQHFKGILKDSSRAVFNGRIFVAKGASNTNAKQLNNNLLLSNQSEIDTKPELIIENPEVKCSHGATVGQLNQEQIFYLMSRGMTSSQAEEMLCRAFTDEIIVSIKDLEIQEKIIFARDNFKDQGEGNAAI